MVPVTLRLAVTTRKSLGEPTFARLSCKSNLFKSTIWQSTKLDDKIVFTDFCSSSFNQRRQYVAKSKIQIKIRRFLKNKLN